MDYNKAMEMLDTLSEKEGAWLCTEVFKRNSDNTLHTMHLDNVIFDEENCIFLYNLGGFSVSLHIQKTQDSKLNFGVSCGSPLFKEDGWYSSPNIDECFKFVRKWFSKT